MRFIKRNLKYILPALIVFFVIVAAIANTSIRGVEKEQKKAMEALNPVEIGEEEILTQRETAIESGTAETEIVLEKKEQTNHKDKVTREDKKEGEEETKGNKEGQQKEGQQKEDSKKVKETKTKITKETIAKQKEQEAKEKTEYPKVVITVPKNEDLRQEDSSGSENQQGEEEGERKISDGKDEGKDKYQTEPVPSGKPLPVNQEEQKVEDEEGFYVTISIDCLTILQNMDNLEKGKDKYVGDGWILKTTKVRCKKGQTVYDILEQVCKAYSIQLESSFTPLYGSHYIEGIGNLYELDCGNLSGWMYNVDGWYPNYGCSRYVLKAGEAIQWRYTCNGLGADLGSDFMSGGNK